MKRYAHLKVHSTDKGAARETNRKIKNSILTKGQGPFKPVYAFKVAREESEDPVALSLCVSPQDR